MWTGSGSKENKNKKSNVQNDRFDYMCVCCICQCLVSVCEKDERRAVGNRMGRLQGERFVITSRSAMQIDVGGGGVEGVACMGVSSSGAAVIVDYYKASLV